MRTPGQRPTATIDHVDERPVPWVIPASVATLFAVELQALGRPQQAQLLAGTVFLLIFATVVLQTITAATSDDDVNQPENVLERPSLSAWMNELGRTGDVQEIEVTASDLVGETIAELNTEIPHGCIVGLRTHVDGTTKVPTGDHQLRDGDRVTFLGWTDAVDRAVKRFHPHD